MLVEGVVVPVEMERKPLRKKLRILYIPVILSVLCITVCIISSMLIYNKTYRFYTEQYYKIAQAFEQVSSFSSTLDLCQKLPSSTAYNNLADAYDIELLSACSDLFSTRFEFDNNERQEIESLYDIVRTSIPDKLNLLKDGINDSEKCKDALVAVRADVTTVADKLNHVIEKSIATGNKAYDNNRIDVYLIEGLMIAIFIGFIIVTAYLISFIEKRIIKPIRDIADWSRMFNDDYADMSDIEITDNDEISDISSAFNIVKAKLCEANKTKRDNESTLRKLREEEEYKKKFVKQLYDEKREKEIISSEAKRDGLTGLYNRRSFDALIDEFMSNKSVSSEGALFLIDMDNFKNVNDTLGHIAGDEALKTLAGAMRIVFPGGYLGRYGGDEFIAFVPSTCDDETLDRLGSSLCQKMDREFEHGGKSVRLSVSVGIVSTVGIGDYAELYMKADKALYFSKEHGRNQYTLASSLDNFTAD